ncbi:MAG: serine hydrolase domain-containing protein [Acidimicrobiales bacterium]
MTAGPLAVVARWGFDAAAGATSPEATLGSHGQLERVFRWASATKLLTSLAILVAAEEGVVALDDAAGPPGSTIRHLLAHASGLAFDDARVLAAPGRRRIYSNRGIEVAAEAVAASAGISFDDYVTAGVMEPLGLAGTTLVGSPAWGASGPLEDLLRLGRELLAPTLVSPAMHSLATAVAFPGLAGVLPGFGRQDPNDWGLGFEVRGHKSPHWTGRSNSTATFGHFGRSGTFLWADPVPRIALASVSATDFGPWAAREWPRLSEAVIRSWGGRGREGDAP